MKNIQGFMKYVLFKGVEFSVIKGELKIISHYWKPDEKTIQQISSNKPAVIKYLSYDRTKPEQSRITDCIHAASSLGCTHIRFRNTDDKYQENCRNCKGYVGVKSNV